MLERALRSCFPMALLAAAPLHAQERADAPAQPDLLDLSLEELLTLESTSVAKKRQRVADSAAAVYVLTQEDIRRSAARTIPDLLRGIPGVEVAQTYTGGYSVTIRGFNSIIANKLLVMVDGRSIYVSTFSGVFWEQLLIPLGDIERIEVVRGPGSTLWGSNAVNGVINIITRHSADTQGARIDARAGPRFQSVAASQGGRPVDGLSYRLWGNFERDRGTVLRNGDQSGQALRGGAAGVRLDWEPNTRDAVTAQADYSTGHFAHPGVSFNQDYANPENRIVDVASRFSNYNLLLRWARRERDDLDWSLQAYYNHIDRNDDPTVDFAWEIGDVDLGVHWDVDGIHDLNAGLNFRFVHDHARPGRLFSLSDPRHTDHWISGYLQDDITLVPEKLRLTLGAKMEENNFSGFEFQPGIRLFYRPMPKLALWAAVSRAVRTPSRFERSARIVSPFLPAFSPENPVPLPVFPVIEGRSGRETGKLLAYEAGLRADLPGEWSLDTALFYNDYSNVELDFAPPPVPVFASGRPDPVGLAVNIATEFGAHARTWGVEALVKGAFAPWWKVEFSWSHLNHSVADDPRTGAPYALVFPLDFSPRDQLSLRNDFDIGRRVAVSSQLRYVAALPGAGVSAYADANLRVTWQLQDALDLSVIGENLIDERRLEFTQVGYPAPDSYVPRQVTAQLQYRF